jgi:alpha-tubulin suppressor-like RCC1 family protein
MSRVETTTNFRDSNGVDLGKKLITKDYLLSVYPSIAQELGKTPELWTWGHGPNGILGNASTTDRSTPVTTFAGGTNWKQVASGTSHTAAIKTDGTLWTWGNGSDGRLGTNDTTRRSTPVTTFAGGTNWKQVSAGPFHTAAIKTDGTLWTWSRGDEGQLGNNAATSRSTPVTTFAGGTNWKQVSCGCFHTAAIKTDGTLWTWGESNDGALGNANPITNRSTPVTTFAGGTNWKQVSSGGYRTAAIKTDGTLWTWGDGADGQLGNNATTNRSTPVTTFAGGTNWKQVSSGNRPIANTSHTAAIKTDGTLWTWGKGDGGQLGTNDTTLRSTPVTTFAGGTNWKQVSSGYNFTAAIKTDGTLWTWGVSNDGQLGNAVTTVRSTPVTTFAGGNNWKQVGCGVQHTAAIQSADFI